MFRRAALACLIFFCPTSVLAKDVVLTTLDDGIRVEGRLVSYDGEFFRVETDTGTLTMDGGLVRCSGDGCPDADDMISRVDLAGPTDMVYRLMPALLEAFVSEYEYELIQRFNSDTAITWDVQDLQTSQTIAVIEGRVEDDGAAVRRLEAGELDVALGRVADTSVRQDVIALDALVPIVAGDNPRAAVTLDQLAGLLSGETLDWSRLGGDQTAVALHLPVGMEDVLLQLHPSADATRHETPEALADAVAADPAALGLVPYSMIGNAVPLIVTGACGLATPATADTIRAEDYPITQPLFISRVGVRQPKILRDFMVFALSSKAQPVIRATGFIDQSIGRIGFDRQGDRIATAMATAGADDVKVDQVRDMIGALMTGERLTLTFRFRDGSSELDPQSASNVHRMADAISGGEFDDRELVFIGFSDGAGDEKENLALSKRRANSVRRAVAAHLPNSRADLTTAAYGEAMPMACDDTHWGPRINRRVEVWLR
jgi:phosphate transport system substrate-binding protein